MADATIVPPTPTVTQGDSPAEVAAAVDNLKSIFDRVLPAVGPTKASPPPSPAAPPVEPPTGTPSPAMTPEERAAAIREARTATPAETPTPTPPEPEKKEPTFKTPSFLEKALKTEQTPSAAPSPSDDEMPEQLPEFKTPEEKTERYRKWRQSYENLKTEVKTLRERPAIDPAQNDRLKALEDQNKTLTEHLNQVSIQTNEDFQREVMQPLNYAWQEATKVIREVGGDPADLANALRLNGREQYVALDEIYENIPQSARVAVQNHVEAFKRFDQVRAEALKNAPRTVQELKRRDLLRQKEHVDSQRKEMEGFFDEAIRVLREEGKVEVLQRSSNPEDKWWNDQQDELVKLSRTLYLDNPDLRKMAMASILAPMADVYRKLWFAEREARNSAEKTLKEKFSSEPSLTEQGGPSRNGAQSTQENLKKPFTQRFIEKVHELERT